MEAVCTRTDAQRRASSLLRPRPPRRPALLGGPLDGVHHLRPRNDPRDRDNSAQRNCVPHNVKLTCEKSRYLHR